MSKTISPNMGLVIPGIGTEQGPDWALDVNSSLASIDQHDHSSGQGVKISPAGLNINADLSMGSNNLTLARTVRFASQTATLTGPADVGAVYEVNGDLYYNDGAGNIIRITQSGSVAGSSGTITGLPSGTASASYNAGTFTFQAATNTPANLDAGSIVLRNNSSGSNGLTLAPPSAMAANYSLTLPALPASTKLVSLDTAGNLTASVTGDNTSINVGASTISVIDHGITFTKLNSNAIMGANSLTFTTSGTFKAPTNVNAIYVDMWGGGGGGGAPSALSGSANPGAGGGAGSVRLKAMIPVTAGVTYTITVGTGGASATPGGGSSIDNGATNLAYAPGGANGGNAPFGAGSGGAGGTAYSRAGIYWVPQAGGGVGGLANSGAAGPGVAGDNTEYAGGGSPGAGVLLGSTYYGGGGAGGGGWMYGAVGGDGAQAGTRGASGGSVANSGSGGGGGLAGTSGGGGGQDGMVTIYWAGPTLGN